MMDRIPVLELGDVLIVSIQGDPQDQDVLALREDLSDAVVRHGARGVIIDITAVEIIDSFIGRMLAAIADMTRLLDAPTVVVGMQPAVAITLAELGLSFGGARTALNLDRGMAMLNHARDARK
ncbi:STAS domain-containing protein [Thermostaphylospora chromogena]|mgnify:CR=1 FL=1|uniref:RsbT antagonist protein RsbS n=1 Tax=Thermostaphylospora chromogena TaxID=35622 RepID=A0A1H1CN41_9ACTN|nr:STAS domain-containing protein [Thermostaphylospora chromogena]SDQ65583.1 rsbT antagonist protein RsbS [Thermostaphylospora chromogena]